VDVEFRPLTEDDIDQVLRLRAIAFGQFGDREGYLASVTWRLPYSLGAFSGGRLRSMSIMIPFEAYVAGRRVTVGGLSGVATAPEARRLGLVARGLRRWFEDLRERGVGWSTEHPFDPTFYARLGYQTVPNGHTLELPLPRLKAAARGATWEGGLVAEPAGPEAAPALARVFAPWARRFSFALTREDGLKPYWDWTFRRPYGDVTHVAYVADDAYAVLTVKDEDGRPEGRTVLVVRDLAYSSPAGRRRVLALLASFEGQADAVRLHLPPGDQVAAHWAAYHTVRSPELQVRVVDLAAALGGLPWPADDRVVLGVSDPDCPWNDGTFVVETGAEGARVTRAAGAEPEARLSIAALAALLTGSAAPASLLADGRAEGSLDALTKLSTPLAGHPVFKPHNDHF